MQTQSSAEITWVYGSLLEGKSAGAPLKSKAAGPLVEQGLTSHTGSWLSASSCLSVTEQEPSKGPLPGHRRTQQHAPLHQALIPSCPTWAG